MSITTTPEDQVVVEGTNSDGSPVRFRFLAVAAAATLVVGAFLASTSGAEPEALDVGSGPATVDRDFLPPNLSEVDKIRYRQIALMPPDLSEVDKIRNQRVAFHPPDLSEIEDIRNQAGVGTGAGGHVPSSCTSGGPC